MLDKGEVRWYSWFVRLECFFVGPVLRRFFYLGVDRGKRSCVTKFRQIRKLQNAR